MQIPALPTAALTDLIHALKHTFAQLRMIVLKGLAFGSSFRNPLRSNVFGHHADIFSSKVYRVSIEQDTSESKHIETLQVASLEKTIT